MKFEVTELIEAIDNPRSDEVIGDLNRAIGKTDKYDEVERWYFVDVERADKLEADGEVIIRYFKYPLYGERKEVEEKPHKKDVDVQQTLAEMWYDKIQDSAEKRGSTLQEAIDYLEAPAELDGNTMTIWVLGKPVSLVL